jgi:hypothetical protein
VKFIPAPDAPPGAPIGEMPQDWLAPPPGASWEDVHPTLPWQQ